MTDLREKDICTLEVTIEKVGNANIGARTKFGIWIDVMPSDLTLLRRAPVDLATCEIGEGVRVKTRGGVEALLVARHDGIGWMRVSESNYTWDSIEGIRPLDAPAPRKGEAFDVRAYVESYEFRGDGGDYTPTENDKAMLEDFAYGLLAEYTRGLLPTAQAPAPNKSEVERLRAALDRAAQRLDLLALWVSPEHRHQVIGWAKEAGDAHSATASAPTCPPGHIMIGDRAVLRGMTDAPEMFAEYWVPLAGKAGHPTALRHRWANDDIDRSFMLAGLIHSTEAAARAHAEALIALSAREG